MTIKLIVGLANPGAEYAATRHNAGAWFVDLLAERLRAPLREEAKFFGYTSRVTLGGEDVRLLVPTTFMNLSGKAVAAMASFFRINPPVSEQKLIDEAIDEAARCTEMWFTDGLTKATNRLHAFKAQ